VRQLPLKRLYPDQPVVGVGAVILDQGKILLEKRKNEPGRGKWTIPGGLVELGETLEHAIVREVEEETCLECEKGEKPRLLDVVDNIDLDEKGKVKYHFVIIDYLVKVTGNVFKAASDAEDLRWVPFDEVEKYDLTSSFRVFFRRNRQKLEHL
jgi:mutator protein MutT